MSPYPISAAAGRPVGGSVQAALPAPSLAIARLVRQGVGTQRKKLRGKPSLPPRQKKIWLKGSGMVSLYVGITDYDWLRPLFL